MGDVFGQLPWQKRDHDGSATWAIGNASRFAQFSGQSTSEGTSSLFDDCSRHLGTLLVCTVCLGSAAIAQWTGLKFFAHDNEANYGSARYALGRQQSPNGQA